jgi:DNA-binding MarR family transcriptional regulator
VFSSPEQQEPHPPGPRGEQGERREQRELVDAFIGASRALVAVAARSLAGLEDEVTLPQYRVLVVLATRGPQRSADLAANLEVTPSTASRMIDRLVRKGLVRRTRTREDRRAVRIQLTAPGREVVALVMRRRRKEVARILRQIPGEDRPRLADALRIFTTAAGEAPEPDWALGWEQ